jgi:DNA oxidative demethylase
MNDLFSAQILPQSSRNTLPAGVRYYPAYFTQLQQENLRDLLRACVAQSPLFTPTMPRTGKPFSVRMTNCGDLGWVSDKTGYRYQKHHPDTGLPWAQMPKILMKTWEKLADYPHPPEACLVNYYAHGTKMGLHQDKDEQDFNAPVLSVSLGDEALFRIGGTQRTDPTVSVRLRSGDVLILGGESRLAFHGIDRIYAGSSPLLGYAPNQGGRINLTLRRVTKP